MSEQSILPSIVKLDHIIHELGWSDLPYLTAIDSLYELVLDGDITLYFDTRLTAIEESVQHASIKSIGGSTLTFETTPIDKSKYRDIYGRKEFYLRGDYINHILDNSICIDVFIQDDVTFLTLDESGESYHPEISYDNIYCLGNELQAFKDGRLQPKEPMNKRAVATNNPKSSKPKKKSIQKEREEAFMSWLKTKTEKSVSTTVTFQERYIEINEPTRDSVWLSLEQSHRTLFASGKDDFFKKQDIIDFTKGTGEHRYKQT